MRVLVWAASVISVVFLSVAITEWRLRPVVESVRNPEMLDGRGPLREGPPRDPREKPTPGTVPAPISIDWDDRTKPIDRELGLTSAYELMPGRDRRTLRVWVPASAEQVTAIWGYAEQPAAPAHFPDHHGWQNYQDLTDVGRGSRFNWVSEPFRVEDPTAPGPVAGTIWSIEYENLQQFNWRGGRYLIEYRQKAGTTGPFRAGSYDRILHDHSGQLRVILPSAINLFNPERVLYYRPLPAGQKKFPWSRFTETDGFLHFGRKDERPWPDERQYWTVHEATFNGLPEVPGSPGFEVVFMITYRWK